MWRLQFTWLIILVMYVNVIFFSVNEQEQPRSLLSRSGRAASWESLETRLEQKENWSCLRCSSKAFFSISRTLAMSTRRGFAGILSLINVPVFIYKFILVDTRNDTLVVWCRTVSCVLFTLIVAELRSTVDTHSRSFLGIFRIRIGCTRKPFGKVQFVVRVTRVLCLFYSFIVFGIRFSSREWHVLYFSLAFFPRKMHFTQQLMPLFHQQCTLISIFRDILV